MISQFEDSEQLMQFLKKHSRILLYFTAKWCGPCKAMGPLLEHYHHHIDNTLPIVKVDIDCHGDVADQYNVMSIPALIVVNAGTAVNSHTGLTSLEHLKEFLGSQTSSSD